MWQLQSNCQLSQVHSSNFKRKQYLIIHLFVNRLQVASLQVYLICTPHDITSKSLMAKLPVESPIKPVITKAKQKRKAKINKSKPNAAKAEVIKQVVVALNKDKNKKVAPVIKVEEKKGKTKNAAHVVKEENIGKQKNAAPVIKEGKKGKQNNVVTLVKEGKKDKKKNAAPAAKIAEKEEMNKNEVSAVLDREKKVAQNLPSEELAEKYPILKNKDLVTKFLAVSITNNQKGRIRQQFRDNLKGTSESILPDVIHNKIKSIVKDTESLSDSELRKIRILYNMLKLATTKESSGLSKVTKNKMHKKNNKGKNNSENGTGEAKENGVEKDDSKKENENKKKNPKKAVKNEKDGETKSDEKKQNENKVKGPKRYVAFVGNLPLDIDTEKIMKHFSELKDHIVDVRIPNAKEGKKSAIAYVELKNEPSYELALSKHHSMLNNRRINVLYSAQQNTKLSKTEVKGKAAKMVALQKSGKLAGSVPLNKKRSQRRAKAKKAQATADD
ncbi:unnamed protein product, partial [Brenthis ino]